MLVKDFEVAQGFEVELNSVVELDFVAAPSFEAEQDFGVVYDCVTELSFEADSYFVFVQGLGVDEVCGGGGCPEGVGHEVVCEAWQREAGQQEYEAA